MFSEHGFCRKVLAYTMETVREHTTAAERKEAWAWRDPGGWFVFHGPDGFCITGRAHCLYDAKAKGWSSWLDSLEPGPRPARCAVLASCHGYAMGDCDGSAGNYKKTKFCEYG